MLAASSSPPRVQDANAVRRRLGSHPFGFALAVTALITAVRLSGTVDSDVSWQLWIAHQINGGARLYRDIVEVNPPLWFWMAVPADGLATTLHVRTEAVSVLFMGLLCAAALAATSQLTKGTRMQRTLVLGYAALMLLAMPWMHSGQREQIVLIGTLPYTALIGVRRSGRAVPRALAIGIGTGAALGFVLKPYFLLVPVLLEFWLLVFRGRSWRPFRPETAAMAAAGLLYALAVFLLARDYLTVTLPLVRLAYSVTGAPHFGDLLQPSIVAAMAAMGLAAAQPRLLSSGEHGLPAALLIAATGFAAVYFIQGKGWIYHAIPLLGCAALSLAAALAQQENRSRLTRLAAPAVLCLPLLLAFAEARAEPAPGADLVHAVDGMRPGDSVGFIATDPALPWSITLQRGLAYPSRYMGFWMMRAVATDEERRAHDPRLSDLGRRVVAETVTDFRCMPPRRIVVARPRPGEDGFDILPFFERDPAFRTLLSHYRPIERTTVELFEIQARYAALPPAICRRAVR
jgi:hypothetical protein